jgi:hypothetical protein
MLRVEARESAYGSIFALEGRLNNDGAEQVRSLAARCDNECKLLFDLTDVMFVNVAGEEVLVFLKRLGAQFIAETAYSLDVCERLRLPLALDRPVRQGKTDHQDRPVS